MWYLMHSNGMGFHSDEHSLLRFIPDHEEEHRAEKTINNHPLIKALREDPKYTESRPHMKMPGSYRSRSLTGGALLGPGKMVVPPYAWIEDGGKSIVSVTYLGDDLCGHPGIVHGGCLATMLDEGLARCCFGALPHNIAVTANLDINYRKPTPAGSFLVLRATTTKVEGRKAWVKGHIELLADPGEEPTILAEATGLFVSPKYAAVSDLKSFSCFSIPCSIPLRFNLSDAHAARKVVMQTKRGSPKLTREQTTRLGHAKDPLNPEEEWPMMP